MGFPINPPAAPLVGPSGNVTPEWYRFFLAIQKMLGGPVSPFDDALVFAHATASQTVDDPLPPPPLPMPDSGDLLQPYPSSAGLFVRQQDGAAWTAATGTEARTALASYAGQTISDPPTQAEVQAIDDAVVAMSQALVALINDLRANGSLT